ncbi:MAG: hypothetical protein CMF38_03535 [Legionellaceae bacterium]|nr:hypothetical protein [Legionellaceae bacterium]HAF87971.1 hypothetical protein [Legionellales bacterium]HCA89293.1 hypothetical protein [Legionellales bacterium]|tara:strand:+ start:384 stop:1094 length:711 start_codon:yes stop_codon:yes gene_type:complete
MDWLELGLSVLTLTLLELILGIDNLVLLSVLTEKLPKHQQKKARRLGLACAWITRLLLLASAVWLTKMTYPLLRWHEHIFSIRDAFLLAGGLFLIAKATQEIHHQLNEHRPNDTVTAKSPVFLKVIIQIALMDIIFSLDSVLTAVGLTSNFWVMAFAISMAILMMICASEWVSDFIERYPTLKMLALSFLILIGTVLIADSFSFHVPRAYIYVAMGFSLGVEALNTLHRSRQKDST